MGRKKKFPDLFEDPEFLKVVDEFHKLQKWYYEECEPKFEAKEREERQRAEALKQLKKSRIGRA